MLCPEVNNFQTNQRNRESIKSGKIGDNTFKTGLKSSLGSLGGGRGVSVIVPHASNDATNKLVKTLQDDTEYYVVKDFSPAILFNKDFLHNFVMSGNLCVVKMHNGCQYVEQSLEIHNKTLVLSLFTDM